MKKIFVALIEMKPLIGCEIVLPKTKGFFARLYIYAESDADAIERIQSWAADSRAKIKKIEWCVDMNQMIWENNENEQAAFFARKAKRTKKVELGDLHSW